jgi:hypothetical protein
MGRRDELGNWSIERNLESFWEIGNFGGWSEKGSTRKRTENWVTSWTFLFWRNLRDLRCFTKRII